MEDIRTQLIDSLNKELIGPSPNPEYLDPETNEELLLARVHGSPQARYGAAMLFPKEVPAEQQPDNESGGNNDNTDEENEEIDPPGLNKLSDGHTEEESGSNEEPVGLANQFKPSAMGFTVRFRTDQQDDTIKLLVKSAEYNKANGQRKIKKRNDNGEIEYITFEKQNAGSDKPEIIEYSSDYWIRRPKVIEPVTLNLMNILNKKNPAFEEPLVTKNDRTWLKLNIHDRTTNQDSEEGFVTLTFTIINDIKAESDYRVNTANILFQNELKLTTDNPDLIAPYPEKHSSIDTIEEDELKLLYRKKQTFAIGHGTAVTWKSKYEIGSRRVTDIETAILPVFEMPQIAPTSYVELSMYNLSDLENWDTSKQSLKKLEDDYQDWVKTLSIQATDSPELENYRAAAKVNAEKCNKSLERIKKGIKILMDADENSDVINAFRWMNRAMIWQQQRSKATVRKWQRTGKDNIRYVLEGIGNSDSQKFQSLEEFHIYPTRGRWRPFQLAFILMNIESVMNPDSEEREIVDLIWFPTGGGKTEAYLGLTAFSIFYRRLKGKKYWNWEDYGGTAAIMRYTLRLLTTQQYERAASLICACDLIRKENEGVLGTEPISIGLWVGGSSTPNKHDEAKTQFSKLKIDTNAEYNFIVMKCPCCAAQIGKLDKPGGGQKIKGIIKQDGKKGKVIFQCENSKCEYYDMPLPLNVVDEYIYENPPTLLLGTVDKFAMVTWYSDAGNIFGFRMNKEDNKWKRITPPELIIQDELHLIAGPLGTMVGLYETMVQTLCNNYDKNEPPFIQRETLNNYVPPKIVASSATISRAFEQVQNLYAIEDKSKLNIFPAQGLSFGDTWFSVEKSLSEDNPGRKYVGILAPGYPSMQTAIVRAYAVVLQKVGELQEKDTIDYYWTLLGYFNSIRELGGASSLVYSDIRERLSQIHQRELINRSSKRFIKRNEELTGRISSSEIPEILKKLEENFSLNNNQALDICLATNMIATGVDISRLGLMFIHGQPKTTAEYIQASSRVGRELPNGPGLIMTLYSPSKPRDKSQYEQFYSYHSRIYSNVEPTSVTPFSINARQRALHAVLIGMVRHFSSGAMRTKAIIKESEFDNIVQIIKDIILTRCDIIDPSEKHFTEQLLDKYIRFWKRGFQDYGDAGNYRILINDDFVPLMYANSSEIRENVKDRSLSTPTSMRGIDTESQVGIVKDL